MPVKITLRLTLTLLAIWVFAPVACAQDAPAAPASVSSPAADTPDTSGDSPVTLFPHSDTSRWWISGQANIILQWHPAFHSPYSGPNSFRAPAENDTSKVYTLYTGFALTHTTEIFVDAESAGGHGLSQALGLAGFTNLDVVRNPALGPTPYLARLLLRQIIPLSSERVDAERGPLGLANSLPARRIEIRVGKMSLVDFLDVNSAGSDSHLQFLNWTVDNNGVYDYAANTRGYTDAAIVEFDTRSWSVRFAEAMMPKVANGIHLDADLFRAHSESYEAEWREHFLAGRSGVIRLLGFENHADMGNYREAINDFLAGQGSRPDIIATRQQGRVKYGFGLNMEQDLTKEFGLFARLGWADGRNESFAYTEVDRTLEIGSYFHGESWRRKNDHAGAVFTMNGIVADHARYLALGGLGFLLGDGALTYGHEKIFEVYYTVHAWRGIFASFDLQHINNPGYNKDRGPVVVPGLRLHVDF
jgi:high affinity Mn2+ porin